MHKKDGFAPSFFVWGKWFILSMEKSLACEVFAENNDGDRWKELDKTF